MKKKTADRKPLVMRLESQAKDALSSSKKAFATDGYQNLYARLGINADNLSAGGKYDFGGFITRDRLLLEAAHRTSWIVGKMVETKAEDMTRAGIDIVSDDMDPSDTDMLQKRMVQLNVWKNLTSAIKWGRLYGGAVAIILIEGQNMSTPLKVDTVGKGSFKGLLPLDRWLLLPSLGNLNPEYGPHFGMPMFYDIVPTSTVLRNEHVHYSRLIRFEGVELPYLWKQAENLWSMSVVERLYDRLLAFDSTTQGAAQLVFKAHLRTVGIKDLRASLAAGGAMEQAVIKEMEHIRRMQQTEGLTVLDAEDTFQTYQYAFSGLDSILLQFGQQLSGAMDIPMVRLFGQSPTGLNSSGESDLRTYYDGINKDQENNLKEHLMLIIDILSRSELSKPLPDGASIKFRPLWQMSDKEKVDMAKVVGDSVTELVNSGIMKKATALKELRQISATTGVYTNISDEDIDEAEKEPEPLPGEEDIVNSLMKGAKKPVGAAGET